MIANYSLTFLLLATEVVTFCLLVLPLPYTIQKKLSRFLAESPILEKVAYTLKISFIFMAIFFADALQRMFRVTAEAEAAKSGGHPATDVTDFAARKFYLQHNTYLAGFALFLSFVLTRTVYIVLDIIHTQEEYAKLKKIQGSDKDSAGEVVVLKKKLQEHEAAQRDFEALKKQTAQQAAEFDRLVTRYNEATSASTILKTPSM